MAFLLFKESVTFVAGFIRSKKVTPFPVKGKKRYQIKYQF